MNNITEQTPARLNTILADIKKTGISASEPVIFIDLETVGHCDINSKQNFSGEDLESVIIVAEGDTEIMDMVDAHPFDHSELIDYLRTTEKI